MSMIKGLQCQNCFMILQSQESLNRHKLKFCINSKYGNVDTLNKQFQTISKGKDISLYGRKAMNPQFDNAINDVPMSNTIQSRIGEENLDKQYRKILRQIGDKQDLRQKLQREKKMAEDELLNLEEKQKDVLVQAKRKDLVDVIKKRQELYSQEELLQKEIKKFQRQRKEEQKKKQTLLDEDYLYRQGRQAGKLAMQRRILQQKKRQIEDNLKRKKRQQQKIKQQLGHINQIPIFIPQFRQVQKIKPAIVNKFNPTPKYTEQTSQKTSQVYQRPNMENLNKKVKQIVPKQNPVYENKIKNQSFRRSKTSHMGDSLDQQEQLFLNPAKFKGHQATLFESLNPKNKSDQDIFIQSLVAQQYDALNVLARLPKDSQLYQVKMKQFQQMSRIRQQLKDKVQKVRLQKVKRQFQFQKQMTQTQKNNLQWLDNNRKAMLHKGVNILQQKNNKFNQPQPYQSPINNNNYNYSPFQNQISKQNIESSHNMNPFTSNKNVPQRPSSTVGMKGYRIVIRNVSHYDSKGPMGVKVFVIEEGQEKPLGAFITKYHDDLASKNQQNPYNPLLKNRRDQSGNIIFNESFECKADLQGIFNRNQNEIYLWVILVQKNQQKISLQPVQYAWYCFKLTHFGQIREGAFTLNLYYQNFTFPEAFDMNRLKKKAAQQITIELSEIIQSNTPIPFQPQHTPQLKKTVFSKKSSVKNMNSTLNLKSQKGSVNQDKGNKLQLKKIPYKQDIVKNIKKQFFISNQSPSTVVPVKKGNKIDLNIKLLQMRTLPSYVGPLKFQISLLDVSNNLVMEKQEFLSQIDDNMYNPKLKYVRKIRGEQLPSSTALMIRIIGLNILNYQPGLLGFAFINLFYDDDGSGIVIDGTKNYHMLTGQYQLPIFWGYCNHYKPYPQIIADYPYIPCTNLLLSLKPKSQAQAQPFPYSSGKYNTTFFQISQIQYRLFQQQTKRQAQDTNEYVKAYFKFKGVNGYDNAKLIKLLSQGLAFTQENIENKLMLSNLAEYTASFGIIVNIDVIRIPQNQVNYYYFCSTCLSPPALYYKNHNQNDLIFIYKIQLGLSLTESVVFQDDSINYSPPFNQNCCLILQLYRVKIQQNGEADDDIQIIGHSIIPLFDIQAEFASVKVGNINIPIYEKEFDSKQDLKNVQSNLNSYLRKLNKQDKSGFSIDLRIMNGYFPNQLAEINNGNKNGKPLRSLFQNSKGFKNSQKSIKQLIQKQFQVELQ